MYGPDRSDSPALGRTDDPRRLPMARKTSRIEIRADEQFIETIATLAEQTHKSRAEVIREALNLYSLVIKERIENKRGIVFKDLDSFPEAEEIAAGRKELCEA